MDKIKKTKWEGTGMKKLKKGFTLIELMIVVAIIAILAAVAAPKMADQLKKAKDAKALAVLGATRSASSLLYADRGDYTYYMADLYDYLDSGAQRVFATTASGTTLNATLNVGGVRANTTSDIGSDTTIEITLRTTTGAAVAGISYGEGEVYLGDGTKADTKKKNWSEY